MRSEIKQPKLLILYAPTVKSCGVATSIETIYRELGKRGWDVTIGLAWGEVFHDPRSFEYQHPGLKTVWMDARTGSEEGRVQAIVRTIKKVKPDIVLHTFLNSVFEAVRRLRAQGIPFQLVTANRGSLPEQAASMIENVDVIDHVICVNRLSYLVMASFSNAFPPGHIHYIPNAVPPPMVSSKRSGRTPKRVGYAGRLARDKRFQDIFPFFRSLSEHDPSVELWVAGDGELAGEIKVLMDAFPERVKYFGSLTRKALYQNFYPAIDAFIHFSPAEGWSLSIGEAMINGAVPVVSMFSGIYTEALLRPTHNALFFPVGDTDSAARLVATLFNNPERLIEISHRAEELLLQEFSPDRFGERWSETLTTMLSKASESVSSRDKAILPKKEMQWETYKEMLRRLLKRRFLHKYSGEEWPHFLCKQKDLIEQIQEKMATIEQTNKTLSGSIEETGDLEKLQSLVLRKAQ
jgi:glycosyltransferase involved in cell wall biosynthesis